MSKKSRLDLLVKVRYLNPLPPPPFPPKLFDVRTDIHRLGNPSYLNHLDSSTQLPMLVDSEMGLPLDLNQYDGIWDGNDLSINQSLDPDRSYHATDTMLLTPLKSGDPMSGVDKAPIASEVSWMRNSSLFTRKANARKREVAARAGERSETVVDISEAAQILTIDKTFLDAQSSNEIRHPDKKKRHLTLVDTYEVLPESQTWGNSYIVIKFPERPSAATATNPSAGASSPRLRSAVLRPIMEDDLQILEYYLPQEDDLDRLRTAYDQPADQQCVDQIKTLASVDGGDPQIDEIFTNAHYDRIRTYEVVTQEKSSREVLLVLDDAQPPTKRRKGAFFKEISMKTALRKTRAQHKDDVDGGDVWDHTRIGFRERTSLEQEILESSRNQVQDPNWVNDQLRSLRGTNEAEGLGEAMDDDD